MLVQAIARNGFIARRPLLMRSLLIVVTATAAIAQQYRITDLGNLGGVQNGVTNTIAYGISNKGQAVGLGCNYALAINDSGKVAYNKDHHPGSGDYTAHRFDLRTSTALDLGALAGDVGSVATSINASGQVAGYSVIHPVNPALDHPFLYDGTGMVSLGSLGGSRGQANALSTGAIVVGWSETPTTPHPNDGWNIGDAFVYVDRTLVNLNNFSRTPGWHLFVANGINNKNKIVGYGLHKGKIRAFRFNFGTTNTVKDLGTFPGGGISLSKAINNKNWIVGSAYLDPSGNGNFRAALWRPGQPTINLNDRIPQNSGWVLFQATSINDVGQIVGWGTKDGDGNIHAFRLDPL